MRHVALLTLSLPLLTVNVALAQPEPRPAATLSPPTHEVMLNLGMASVVGFAGLTYACSPGEVLQFEAGVGFGATGVQLTAMPKVNVGSSMHRFVGGVGVSTGIDRAAIPGSDGSRKVIAAYWLNAEVGYELRVEDGLTVLVAVGVTSPLGGRTQDDMHCIFECDDSDAARGYSVFSDGGSSALPQARVALGFSF